LTAILTIFCNIIKDPLQLSSDSDVKLLYDVPNLMCKIPIRYLTGVEIMHLKFLDGFMTELARLGRCAISKAHGELFATIKKDSKIEIDTAKRNPILQNFLPPDSTSNLQYW
jgi:hypothetical protein